MDQNTPDPLDNKNSWWQSFLDIFRPKKPDENQKGKEVPPVGSFDESKNQAPVKDEITGKEIDSTVLGANNLPEPTAKQLAEINRNSLQLKNDEQNDANDSKAHDLENVSNLAVASNTEESSVSVESKTTEEKESTIPQSAGIISNHSDNYYAFAKLIIGDDFKNLPEGEKEKYLAGSFKEKLVIGKYSKDAINRLTQMYDTLTSEEQAEFNGVSRKSKNGVSQKKPIETGEIKNNKSPSKIVSWITSIELPEGKKISKTLLWVLGIFVIVILSWLTFSGQVGEVLTSAWNHWPTVTLWTGLPLMILSYIWYHRIVNSDAYIAKIKLRKDMATNPANSEGKYKVKNLDDSFQKSGKPFALFVLGIVFLFSSTVYGVLELLKAMFAAPYSWWSFRLFWAIGIVMFLISVVIAFIRSRKENTNDRKVNWPLDVLIPASIILVVSTILFSIAIGEGSGDSSRKIAINTVNLSNAQKEALLLDREDSLAARDTSHSIAIKKLEKDHDRKLDSVVKSIDQKTEEQLGYKNQVMIALRDSIKTVDERYQETLSQMRSDSVRLRHDLKKTVTQIAKLEEDLKNGMQILPIVQKIGLVFMGIFVVGLLLIGIGSIFKKSSTVSSTNTSGTTPESNTPTILIIFVIVFAGAVGYLIYLNYGKSSTPISYRNEKVIDTSKTDSLKVVLQKTNKKLSDVTNENKQLQKKLQEKPSVQSESGKTVTVIDTSIKNLLVLAQKKVAEQLKEIKDQQKKIAVLEKEKAAKSKPSNGKDKPKEKDVAKNSKPDKKPSVRVSTIKKPTLRKEDIPVAYFGPTSAIVNVVKRNKVNLVYRNRHGAITRIRTKIVRY